MSRASASSRTLNFLEINGHKLPYIGEKELSDDEIFDLLNPYQGSRDNLSVTTLDDIQLGVLKDTGRYYFEESNTLIVIPPKHLVKITKIASSLKDNKKHYIKFLKVANPDKSILKSLNQDKISVRPNALCIIYDYSLRDKTLDQEWQNRFMTRFINCQEGETLSLDKDRNPRLHDSLKSCNHEEKKEFVFVTDLPKEEGSETEMIRHSFTISSKMLMRIQKWILDNPDINYNLYFRRGADNQLILMNISSKNIDELVEEYGQKEIRDTLSSFRALARSLQLEPTDEPEPETLVSVVHELVTSEHNCKTDWVNAQARRILEYEGGTMILLANTFRSIIIERIIKNDLDFILDFIKMMVSLESDEDSILYDSDLFQIKELRDFSIDETGEANNENLLYQILTDVINKGNGIVAEYLYNLGKSCFSKYPTIKKEILRAFVNQNQIEEAKGFIDEEYPEYNEEVEDLVHSLINSEESQDRLILVIIIEKYWGEILKNIDSIKNKQQEILDRDKKIILRDLIIQIISEKIQLSRESVQELRTQNLALRIVIDSQIEQIKEQQEQKSKDEEAKAKYEAKIEKLKEQIHTLEQKLSKVNKGLKSKSKEVNELKEKNGVQESRIKLLEEQETSYQDKIRILEEEIEQLKQREQENLKESSSKQEEIAGLESQNQSLRQDNERLILEMRELRREMERLRSRDSKYDPTIPDVWSSGIEDKRLEDNSDLLGAWSVDMNAVVGNVLEEESPGINPNTVRLFEPQTSRSRGDIPNIVGKDFKAMRFPTQPSFNPETPAFNPLEKRREGRKPPQ